MNFDGIIGAEFIKQFVIEVDYPGRVIRLHDKNQFSYSGSGESIPVQLDRQGHPILDAEVTPLAGEPIKGKFVLDLGAGGALALMTTFVAEHGLLDAENKDDQGPRPRRRRWTEQWARRPVAELKIGKYKIANPVTIFSEDKAGAFATSVLAGNIGHRSPAALNYFSIMITTALSLNRPPPSATLSIARRVAWCSPPKAVITRFSELPTCWKIHRRPKPACKRKI
jgi:hypothetical protein